MEQKFGVNSIDLQELYDFCERVGETVSYQKGERMEREGEPSRWFGFVAKGCFKYVTQGISDGKEHITWFSFEGEYVGDYPSCLNGSPSQTTIEAMMPSSVLRVSGEQLMQLFNQNTKTMELRCIIGEHLLSRHVPVILTSTAPRLASVTTCCSAVVPESWSIFPCMPSPHS